MVPASFAGLSCSASVGATGGSKLAEQLAQQQAQRQQSPDGRGGKMNALDLRDGDTDLTSLTKVTSNQRQQKQSNDGGTNEVNRTVCNPMQLCNALAVPALLHLQYVYHAGKAWCPNPGPHAMRSSNAVFCICSATFVS